MLEKYKLITISYDNSGRFPTKTIDITAIGEQVYDLIVKEFSENINYKKELKPIPDGTVLFSNIKYSLNGLSGNDILHLFINDRNIGTSSKKESETKFIKNGLKKTYSDGDKTHQYRYDFTDLGKEVLRQLFSILKDRLQLKS